jgi:uncharacterized protein YegP (UPF0339 family)
MMFAFTTRLALAVTLAAGWLSSSSTAAADAPAVLFTDVEAGPSAGGPGGHGVPIAIFGKGFGATRGSSKVTINGTEVAAYLAWGQNNANNSALDMIVVQPAANTASGALVVSVGGLNSNADHTFTPSGGKIYYVAPGGTDAAPCSLTQPCATVLHTATNIMQAGDALLVRGGNLNDDEIWIREELGHSGQPGKPKIIRNYPGEAPVFALVNRPVILDANYITFSGFHFIGGKSIGAGREGLRGQRVYNSTFRGTISWDAIGTHGDDIVLAGNDCDVTASSVGTQGHCYYISHGNNIKLLYNVGRGAPGYGIHIFDQRRSANDIVRVISNVLVEGNLLAASPERSGLIVAMGDEDGIGNHVDGITIRNNLFVANNFAGIAVGGNVRNVKIYHNTFYQNGRQGITLYDEPSISGVEIINNLIDQSANANCRANCSWYQSAHVEKGARAQGVAAANNFYAPAPPVLLGATDSAPASGAAGFINAAGGDYHLAAGSAAIGKGRALPSVARDFDGRARAQAAPDAGAFERSAGTTGQGTTLSANPASVASGASLTASWSGIATPSALDWIGLHRPGTPSQSFIDWMYVSCSKSAGAALASGSCSFPIPSSLASGTYELRLHSANSFTVIATSAALSVTGAASTASLSATPAGVASGASVNASWSGIATATGTDWIGLHRPGTPSQNYIDWMYVSCSKSPGTARASGSCAFPIPGNLASGTYELRLHSANGFTVIATSAALTVTGTAQTGILSVSPSTLARGASATVSWSALTAPGSANWIGLHQPGTPSQNYIDWIYVSCSKIEGAARASGSCAFTIPSTLAPGTYEFRLHAPRSWNAILVSAALTVQ